MPAIASPPPTSMAVSTRGRRKLEDDRLRGGRPRLGEGEGQQTAAEDRRRVPDPDMCAADGDRRPRPAATSSSVAPPRTSTPRASVTPIGSGRASPAATVAAWRRSKASGWMARASASRPGDDPWPGARDQDVLRQRQHPPRGDGRNPVPARTARDRFGGERRVVGSVTQQDHLRIGGDEVLERDGGRQAVAEDRIAAGDLDQRREERARPGGVDGALGGRGSAS